MFDFFDLFNFGDDFLKSGGGRGWAADAMGTAADGFGGRGASWAADSLGGASESLLGKIGESFTRIFTGEASITDGLASLFRNFGAEGGTLLDEYLIYDTFFKKNNGGEDFGKWYKRGGSKSLDPEILAAKETLKSHALLAELLEKHAAGSDVAAEYKNLGLNLPDEKLLKNVKRALSPKLHPDKNVGTDEVIKEMNAALKHLEKSENHEAYRNLLRRAEEEPGLKAGLDKLFKNFSKFQEKCHYRRATEKLKALPFQNKSREELKGAQRLAYDINKGIEKMSPTGKAALAVGIVGGTAAAAYGVMKYLDKKDNKSKAGASHSERVKQEKTQQVNSEAYRS